MIQRELLAVVPTMLQRNDMKAPEVFFGPILSMLNDQVWLAGGSLVRWVEGEAENKADFDIFATDPQQVVNELKHYLDQPPVQESSLSVTFRHPFGDIIQVIKRPYSSLENVLESFDFKARMLGTDGQHFLYAEGALEDIENRVIKHHDGNFSITTTSLFGLTKYANRGYTLSHTEARKFLASWGVRTVDPDGPGY